MKFKESVQIGNLNLRNRIVMPPMATGRAKDGKPGDDLVESTTGHVLREQL